jgi:hypothetical protein
MDEVVVIVCIDTIERLSRSRCSQKEFLSHSRSCEPPRLLSVAVTDPQLWAFVAL